MAKRWTYVVVEFRRAFERCSRVHGAEVEQAGEHGAVVAHVVVAEMLGEGLQVLRRDPLQEVDIVLGMEAAHVVHVGLVRPIYLVHTKQME